MQNIKTRTVLAKGGGYSCTCCPDIEKYRPEPKRVPGRVPGPRVSGPP